MGTGKSTIGFALARELGYTHIDTDHAIVKASRKKITQIFEDEGEEHFRRLETDTLHSLSEKTHHIISTGGGIITRAENRELLPRLGYVVWLRAEPDEILARTSKNNKRPLLQTDNPLLTIQTLLEERSPLYRECAHLTLDTGGLNSSEVITGIIESANYHFSRNP